MGGKGRRQQDVGSTQYVFKKYYEFKNLYSNARPGRMGSESAVNVADKSELKSNDLKNYLDGLRNTTRADKEQMNHMDSTNEAMVEFYQQLMEAIIQQRKK